MENLSKSYECAYCKSTDLIVKEVYIDFSKCEFVVICECIDCGMENVIILSLELFITINQLFA